MLLDEAAGMSEVGFSKKYHSGELIMKYVGSAVVILIVLGLCAAVIVPSLRNDVDHHDNNAQGKSYDLEPLRVRRTKGQIEIITLADAMARHYGLDHHDHHDSETQEHYTGKVCIGVAVGYQAVRYASKALFADDIPASSDLELSAVGNMHGTWDTFDLYMGETLARPKPNPTGMSLDDFTFTAKRLSTGRTITFRLREGVIPNEFFQWKNRGVGCDNRRLRDLKQQAVDSILTQSPKECFEKDAKNNS
jgi:hypothetical protein